jgi:hypothetical protein
MSCAWLSAKVERLQGFYLQRECHPGVLARLFHWIFQVNVLSIGFLISSHFHRRSLYDQILPLVLINLPTLTIQCLNTLMTAAAMRCRLWNHSRQPLLGSPSSATLLHHRIVPGFVRHPVVRGFSSLEDGSLKSSESYLIGPNEPPLYEHPLPFHWGKHILPNYHDQPALISKTEPPSPTHQRGKSDCLRLSYSELDQCITSMALGLHQLGVR